MAIPIINLPAGRCGNRKRPPGDVRRVFAAPGGDRVVSPAVALKPRTRGGNCFAGANVLVCERCGATTETHVIRTNHAAQQTGRDGGAVVAVINLVVGRDASRKRSSRDVG